jgi:catechol 2,3-dioxygenase-like lactoylglutathione lyase family enzyme
LPTRDLKKAATFYAALLDRPVPIVKDAVYVTEWLTFCLGDATHQGTESILRFAVDDVPAAAKLLGVEGAAGVVRGRDPDGRRVEILAAAPPRSR